MSSQNTTAKAASVIAPRLVHARYYRLFLTRHHGQNKIILSLKFLPRQRHGTPACLAI
jgi:hypothetical protein